MKAYDRVKHSFIWPVMQVMGFNKHLIKLARGLVETTESKVHINRQFTESIKLKRGRSKAGLPPFFVALHYLVTTFDVDDQGESKHKGTRRNQTR